jgi:hypothetical protein
MFLIICFHLNLCEVKTKENQRSARETRIWINHHRRSLQKCSNFQFQICRWDQTLRHLRCLRKIQTSDTDLQWSWQNTNAHSIIYCSKNESTNNPCFDSVHSWLLSILERYNSGICAIKNLSQQTIFHSFILRAWFSKELDPPSRQTLIRDARDRDTLI